MSAFRDYLSNSFPTTIQAGDRSFIFNLMIHHAVTTGNHLSWDKKNSRKKRQRGRKIYMFVEKLSTETERINNKCYQSKYFAGMKQVHAKHYSFNSYENLNRLVVYSHNIASVCSL
jgi:hypothetical protein